MDTEKELVRFPITWRIVAFAIMLLSAACLFILTVLTFGQAKRDINVMNTTTIFMFKVVVGHWEDVVYSPFWITLEVIFYTMLLTLIVYVQLVGCPNVVVFTECFK